MVALHLQGPTLFREAVFVPPGYMNVLYAHQQEDNSCRQPTQLFQGFRDFVLAPFGRSPPKANNSRPGDLTARLISRKPSQAKPVVARQIANEDELMTELQQLAARLKVAKRPWNTRGRYRLPKLTKVICFYLLHHIIVERSFWYVSSLAVLCFGV